MPVCQFQHQRSSTAYYNRLALLVKQQEILIICKVEPWQVITGDIMTRIVVDAMGSDNYPTPDVQGAIMAAREYGVEIILVGDEAKIRPTLAAMDVENLPVRVVHAPEMLTMEDKGMALALKARRPNARNSMAIGIDLVKNGEADVFVTAGNTGACVATSYFRLGTIEGVDLPALVGPFPTASGVCLVVDIG